MNPTMLRRKQSPKSSSARARDIVLINEFDFDAEGPGGSSLAAQAVQAKLWRHNLRRRAVVSAIVVIEEKEFEPKG